MKYPNPFRDARIMTSLGVVLAFLIPGPAEELKVLLIPALTVMMVVSLKNVPLPRFDHDNFKEAAWLLGLTFVVQPLLYLAAAWFVTDPWSKTGLIMLGLMPPAISVIPLSFLLHVDLNHALFAEVMGYLFSFLFIPVSVFWFFQQNIQILPLLQILILILVLPIILSRFIPKSIHYDFKELVNLILAYAVYLGLALNIDRIIANPFLVGELLLIFLVIRIVFALIIYFIGKWKKAPLRETALFTLFGTLKNGGVALGILLALFDPRTILPLAVLSLFYPLQLVFLTALFDGEHHLLRGLRKQKA